MVYESLSEYLARTSFMYWQPGEDTLWPHPQVGEKVTPEGGYLPFWGDTMLFYLEEGAQRALDKARAALYRAGLPLSAPLKMQQFHMTLHDLDHTMGCDRRWDDTRRQAEEILSGLAPGAVTLEPVAVFPMMNTSLVVGYRPATEEDCRLLQEWFAAFQPLFPCGTPTFHVTLAYLRPGAAGRMSAAALGAALEEVNAMPLPVLRLNKEGLVYQRFTDMNRYFTLGEEELP